MGAKLKRYEVEAVAWVRAKIEAKSSRHANDQLLDRISVEEEMLHRISGGDYNFGMFATTKAAAGVTGDNLDRLKIDVIELSSRR